MQSSKIATIRRSIRQSFIQFVTPITCPKCSSTFRSKSACPRCGLATERMSDYVRREQPVDETLTRAWAAVTVAWELPAVHDELLRLTTQHGAWAWAAARYREASQGRTDQIAAAQLRRLEKGIVVSTFGIAQAREDKTPKPYRAATTMLVILIVVLVAGFVYGKTVRRSGAPTPATSAAAQMTGVK